VLSLALLLEENKDIDIDGLYVDAIFKGLHHYTMLYYAFMRKATEIIRFLISIGADVNGRSGGISDKGAYPLIYACCEGELDNVELLLDAGANPNIGVDEWTPLTAALENSNFHLVDRLLLAGADARISVPEESLTPLHIIFYSKENLACVKRLIEWGVDVNHQDIRGKTPLHVALAKNSVHIECVEALLTAGAYLNIQDEEGVTPFHVACRNPENHELIEEMLKMGADPNIPDQKGWTALHIICSRLLLDYLQSPSLQAASILMKYGANKDIRTNEGLLPIDCLSTVDCLSEAMRENLIHVLNTDYSQKQEARQK